MKLNISYISIAVLTVGPRANAASPVFVAFASFFSNIENAMIGAMFGLHAALFRYETGAAGPTRRAVTEYRPIGEPPICPTVF